MDFSFITSHNIRSSVANIIGLTQMLRQEPGNSTFLAMLQDSTDKLDESIRNISELLNFENEFNSNEKSKCNVYSTIQRILDMNNDHINREEVDIRLKVNKKLHIDAIPAFLDSIFHNLITNALKYGITDDSKVIEISARKVKNNIKIQVTDYGEGIDLDRHQADLFKIGARFHGDKYNGQGHGLYMTKHQIEAMGGFIEVASEVGKGTTFKITFNA